MTQDDKALIINLRKGDFKAFDRLFYKYSKRLYGFALGYLKIPEDAEELVQEIFIKVWDKRDKLDETKSFKAYLFTIAKNSILNHFRNKAYQQSYIDYIKHHTKLLHNQAEEQIEYSDLDELTKNAIDKLPPKRKQIFKLSREQGLTYDEIAMRMNISPKTVETQISQALKYIRKELGENSLIVLLFLNLFF